MISSSVRILIYNIITWKSYFIREWRRLKQPATDSLRNISSSSTQKRHHFHENKKLITSCTTSYLWATYWSTWKKDILQFYFMSSFNIIPHPLLGLPRDLFHTIFLTNVLRRFSHMRVTSYVHFIPPGCVHSSNNCLTAQCTFFPIILFSPTSCHFLFLMSTYSLRALFSNTKKVCMLLFLFSFNL